MSALVETQIYGFHKYIRDTTQKKDSTSVVRPKLVVVLHVRIMIIL